MNSILDNFGEEDDIDRVDGVIGYRLHKCREFVYRKEKAYNKITDIFLKSINMAADSRRGEGFSSLRMTFLGRPEILLRMSEIEEAKQF